MTFSLTTPLSGSSISNFVTPTYTLVADTPPNMNAKQYVVSAHGGTQVGVTDHSVASPFTLAMFRPANLQVLQPVNPVTGVLNGVPMNIYKMVTRKGVLPLAGQAYRTMKITTIIEVPAGADTADANNVKAGLCAHGGMIAQASSGVGDVLLTGTL